MTCHPQTPATAVKSIEASVERTPDRVRLEFRMACQTDEVVLPDRATRPERRDGLWQTTCFEMFVGGDSYCEFNFSPSLNWAAYDFDGYRAGSKPRPVSRAPEIAVEGTQDCLVLRATLFDTHLAGRLALAAVIEETDGTKSYWALVHPPGQPDFHHPACFAATLPAPGA
ncbi:MAG: DOMON-like domain-containing protein [Sphingomonadales bacterium]|nr:DOMON-like domain-containing protein [Sphingomonadales bacterium]